MSGDNGRADRPVRVLLTSPTFGAFGGMEATLLALAEGARCDPRVSVRVCFKKTSTFALQRDLDEACRSTAVDFCARGSRALWSHIAWADVVHAQNASLDIAVFCAILRKPLALALHNTLPDRPALLRMSWRLGAALATTRWYNSQFVWRTWEPRRRRRGSAHVRPTSRLHDAYVPPADRRGFVFLGRLVPGKGADVLIEAYRRARLDPARWPLTIVGDGPMRAELERRAAAGGGHIRFVGFAHGCEKAAILASAKWLVVPSHWHEPFGIVAVEARHVGVPVVVTDDGGLPEAAGRDALVCQAGDVGELARALREASGMPEADYEARAERTQRDLAAELPPPSFYTDAYVRLARRAGDEDPR